MIKYKKLTVCDYVLIEETLINTRCTVLEISPIQAVLR